MTEKITIDKTEYDELTKASCMLTALELCGVEHWECYNEAKELMEQWDE